jgi:hypothetical protein
LAIFAAIRRATAFRPSLLTNSIHSSNQLCRLLCRW